MPERCAAPGALPESLTNPTAAEFSETTRAWLRWGEERLTEQEFARRVMACLTDALHFLDRLGDVRPEAPNSHPQQDDAT